MSTDFPSITFPATFEGTAAIGADFSATLKLKTNDGPKVLEDLKALPRGTYDVTIVSRQGALAGDSLDREWASTALQEDMQDAGDLDFAEHCIGGQCPHFAVATSGELEGAYVCQLDPEAPVKIVHGETACPLYPAAEPEGNADDDGVEHLDFEASGVGETGAEDSGIIPGEPEDAQATTPCVYVLWPGETEMVSTEVGQYTTYGELIADYLAQSGIDAELGEYVVLDVDDEQECPRTAQIAPSAYGSEYRVVPVIEHEGEGEAA